MYASRHYEGPIETSPKTPLLHIAVMNEGFEEDPKLDFGSAAEQHFSRVRLILLEKNDTFKLFIAILVYQHISFPDILTLIVSYILEKTLSENLLGIQLLA